MSTEKLVAEKFSNKNKKPDQFSVIFFIKNLYEDDWISNGVDIHELSKYKKEKEVLFHPFSFYIIKEVTIDINNLKAEIFLETIGKKEILEKEIQIGKYVKYNKDFNIVESVNSLSSN